MSTNKIVASAVGFSLAFAAFVGVGAASAGAQAMTLSQLVDLFISLGIISSDKAAAAKAAVTTATPAMSFSKDLTIGSTGADVSALQAAIGVTPATGYFGSITAAAVKSYQASKGISATGYVGPLTRAALNGSVTTTTTTTTTTGGTTTTVVNTGVEGILNINKSSISNSTAYEGDSARPILAFKAEAKLSDISIQRVKLDLGTSTTIYTKVYKTMSLVDDSGKTIASADLNSNTVVKDSGSYYLTLGGFSYVVPKNASKVLTVKADLYSSIKDTTKSWTVSLADDGVRGTDGAGIDQLAPTTGSSVSQQISLSTSLVESAALKITSNSAVIKTTETVASSGALNNELDKLPLLVFDVKAEKDSVTVTDLPVVINESGAGNLTNAYLFEGSNQIASESVVGNTVTFEDVDLSFSKDQTRTFTIKVDVRNATATATTIQASTTLSGLVAENSQGSTLESGYLSGTATGEAQIVRNVGPSFALVGTPTIAKEIIGQTASSTFTATFAFDVKAERGSVTVADTGAFVIGIYSNGLQVATTSAIYEKPTTGITVSGNDYVIGEGSTARFTAQKSFTGPTATYPAGAIFTARLESITWNSTASTYIAETFRATKSASGSSVTF